MEIDTELTVTGPLLTEEIERTKKKMAEDRRKLRATM